MRQKKGRIHTIFLFHKNDIPLLVVYVDIKQMLTVSMRNSCSRFNYHETVLKPNSHTHSTSYCYRVTVPEYHVYCWLFFQFVCLFVYLFIYLFIYI